MGERREEGRRAHTDGNIETDTRIYSWVHTRINTCRFITNIHLNDSQCRAKAFL